MATGDATDGVSYVGKFGKWGFNSLSAFDMSGDDFLAQASNVTKTKGLTPLHIWFSETDAMAAIGPLLTVYTTTLAQNDVPKGWTVMESAYLNPANTPLFGTAILLASETFTDHGSVAQTYKTAPMTGPYELTEEVTITLAKGAELKGDGVLSSLDIQTAGIPEAHTWAMVALGFAGIGFAGVARRRRNPRAAL